MFHGIIKRACRAQGLQAFELNQEVFLEDLARIFSRLGRFLGFEVVLLHSRHVFHHVHHVFPIQVARPGIQLQNVANEVLNV